MLKKSISILLALVMIVSAFTVVPVAASAEEVDMTGEGAGLDVSAVGVTSDETEPVVKSGTTGSCTWTLVGTELTISGNGPMGDIPRQFVKRIDDFRPWSRDITKVTISEGVTSIGECAFSSCYNLKSIAFPNSVISIGDYALYNCYDLTSVTIPNSVTSIGEYAFYKCSCLTSVTIPNSVTSIGGSAFSGCSGLTSVTIPNSVTSIGSSAFSGCSGLTSVAIPNSVTSIGDWAFYGCSGLTSVTIPNSVTSIGKQAFYNCSGLTSVTIPNSVTSIGESAFSGCPLTSLKLGNSVTSIGNAAFYGCKGLTSLTIPDSVTSIGGRAFYNCTGLTSLKLGDSVESIGSSAFYNCSGLTSVTIPNSVTSIGESAFSGCTGLTGVVMPDSIKTIGYGLFKDCTVLTRVTIPNSVTSIGNYAFNGCSGLKSVTIPNSVTSIGYYAFNGCSSLKSVTIPNSVTSIDGSAFSGCTGLTSVMIPDSVTSIYGSAFSGCTGLKNITIPDSVGYIGEEAFSGCTSLTSVVIPDSIDTISYGLFKDCSALKSVTIPDTVMGIGPSAFYGCSELTDAVIGANAKISDDAFKKCEKLTITGYTNSNAYFYAEKNNIPFVSLSDLGEGFVDFVFKVSDDGTMMLRRYNGSGGTVIIPSDIGGRAVVSIDDYAFYNCRGITSVTIPNSVTSIGDYAFFGCSGLTSVAIPNSITSIGNSAFRDCSGLTSVTIPDSVTSIDDYAFSGCTGLTSVTIPDSVTSIGDYAFSGCTRLTNVTIGIKTKIYNYSHAFENCRKLTITGYPNSDAYYYAEENNIPFIALSDTGKDLIYEVNDDDTVTITGYNGSGGAVVIPSAIGGYAVTCIGNSAFRDCTSLESVSIPDSVTSISSYAFDGCTSLASITIPDSVTSIGNSAFRGCTSLASITIPDSVTSIGDSAFYECTSLASITIPDSVTSIGDSAFYECKSLTSYTIKNPYVSMGYCSCGLYEELRDILVQHGSGENAEYDWDWEYYDECVTGVVIKGFSNSSAQKYAEKYDMTFVPLEYFDVVSSYDLSLTGRTKLTLDFSIKDKEKSIKSADVIITVDNKEVLSGKSSVYLNNKKLTGYTLKDGVFTIPLGDTRTGSLSVIFDSQPQSTLRSTAKIRISSGDTDYNIPAGEIEYNEFLTLEAPEKVGSASIPVSGKTSPGTNVTLYIDGKKATVAKANLAGDYSASLTIPGTPVNDQKYRIKAEYTDSKSVKHTAERDVTYHSDYPELLEFTMTYRGQTYDLLAYGKRDVTFILIRYGGKYPFRFDIKFKDRPKGQVSVISTRGGETKYMYANYVSSTGKYTAEGYFQPYEDDYVPGILDVYVEGVGSVYHKDAINWSIDPSGYVYAGMDSDRVYNAEVTAYYIPYDSSKDNDSFWNKPDESRKKKWNAAEYSQNNPIYTTLDGDYAWDVPEGWWQLEIKKDGYKTYKTEWMTVLPPRLDVNINLQTTMAPKIEKAELNGDEIKLTFLNAMKPESLKSMTLKDSAGKNVTYQLKYEAETGSNGEKLAKVFTLKLSSASAGTYTIECAKAENYSGVKGSVKAETGAEFLPGDVNGDGKVSIADYSKMNKHVCKVKYLTDEEIKRGDVNGDGKVTIADLSKLNKHICKVKSLW